MKNFIKLMGITALVAIIGFSMAACSDGADNGNGGIPNSGNPNGGTGIPYTVTYNANGAVGTPPQPLTVNGGTNITLRDDSGFSKDGYIFDGWYTSINGTTTYYDSGSSYTITDNVYFYANWIYARTVTLDTNGQGETTSRIIGNGKTTILPTPVSSRGFQFCGWYTNVQCTGDQYSAGSSYTVNSNVTFYAKWSFSGKYSYSYDEYVASYFLCTYTYSFIFRTDGTYDYYLIRDWRNGSQENITLDESENYYIAGNVIYPYSLTYVDSSTITFSGDPYTLVGLPAITTTSLPDGEDRTEYSQTLTATGDTPITWSVETGSLPNGLTLSTEGVISGTPTTVNTFNFTVLATNEKGRDTKQLSIVIVISPIEMVSIPGGTFIMGSPTSEPNRASNETQHSVTLSGFKMGKYQVTQEQYQAVMGSNPSLFTSAVTGESGTPGKLPVETVRWYDALVFCNKLSVMDGLSPAYSIGGSTDPAAWGTVPYYNYGIVGDTTAWDAVEIVSGSTGYRLPTEAQWEYACRAGTATAYNTGDTISDSTGWYIDNSGGKTHQVGLKPANAWGLYDMHGNVWEWCWDWFEGYSSEVQTDPMGASSGTERVLRGGGRADAEYLRSACRVSRFPYDPHQETGFRLVRP